ncbi:MAG: hypothetical protein K9G76_04545 [Bacteroidales bacterium]|nr:hypothetical protein [Bacteroidales bacterium]MCF8402946.1 hypothetical protein [Bacteroidales bacterium]
MLKKITSAFFILIAVILLMVFGTIPHHHHHDVVCIESIHCQDDAGEIDHHNHQPSHEHDNPGNTDHCVVYHVVLFPANQIKPGANHVNTQNQNNLSFFVHSLIFEKVEANIRSNPFFRINQYRPSIITPYLISYSGVRGPPMV